jgi:hypothetical protein
MTMAKRRCRISPEIAITGLDGLHRIVSSRKDHWHSWFYRGQANASFPLIPKAGRPEFNEKDDSRMFERWKRHAVAFLPLLPQQMTDWDLLAVAQHHGLATRLLDWSFNPLAAAFFAVESEPALDGVIYAHFSTGRPIEPSSKRDPFSLTGVTRLSPSSVAPRILRQGGIFTLHGPPSVPMHEAIADTDRLERFVIPAAAKRNFAVELSHVGVNRMSLFPDLDGLSRHINWSFTHLPYPAADASRSRRNKRTSTA